MRVPKWWYRLQLWLLGKPASKSGALASVVFLWVAAGVVLFAAITFTVGFAGAFTRIDNADNVSMPFIGVMMVILWGLAVYVAWVAYDNMKEGYIDAIYKCSLKNYQSRRRHLLGKLNAQK
jgi:fatty acid desaturase